MTLTGPTTAVLGSTFTEKVTITDLGPGRASNVTTTLLVPAGLALPPDPSEPPPDPVVWTGTTLAAGASTTFTLSLTVTAARPRTVAIGGFAVSFASKDPKLSNNTAIEEIRLVR
jgi:hypothetical protein